MAKSNEELIEEISDGIESRSDKSRKAFEKSLTYISSGVLVGSVFFIEKIIPLDCANNKIFLLLSLIFSGFTLLLSLVVHYLSSVYFEKAGDEFSRIQRGKGSLQSLIKKVIKRDNITKFLTVFSLISLIVGIILLMIFVTSNLL